MMSTGKTTSILLTLVLTLAVGSTAQAQIGGLIKKKVGDAVKGPDKPAEEKKAGAQTIGTVSGSDVLEITQPVLDGFVSGLSTEIALRKEFRAELAKYPTPEQYKACKTGVAMSAEGQKILERMTKMPENATADEQAKIMEKMGTDMAELTKKRCPLDPEDWSDYKRKTRLEEIRTKAAASVVIEGWPYRDDASAANDGGPSDLAAPVADPVSAAALTLRQYEILLERIQRFCSIVKSAANTGGSGGVKIPGTGKNIFWVFTAAEAKTLSEANCQRVSDLVGQLI